VVRRRLLLTLLFLGAVGLHRTWDLRSYTGDGLALPQRSNTYGYRKPLSQVAWPQMEYRKLDGCARSVDDRIFGIQKPKSSMNSGP